MKTALQTGFATLYIVAAVVLLAAVVGWGEYRYSQGVIKERTKNLNAVLEHEAKMSTERRKHNEELESIEKKQAAISDKANRQIRELLATNKTLADWWGTSIPADVVDFIWMPNTSDNHPLRSGPVPDSTAIGSGKTGEAD